MVDGVAVEADIEVKDERGRCLNRISVGGDDAACEAQKMKLAVEERVLDRVASTVDGDPGNIRKSKKVRSDSVGEGRRGVMSAPTHNLT